MKRILSLLAALCLILSGCAPRQSEPTAPAETAAPTVETAVPTTEVTEAPTETAAPTTEATEAPTEATEPPQWDGVLHSGLREDGTFDGGTLFIGDSQTYGFIYFNLIPRNRIGDARYASAVGIPAQAYFSGTKFSEYTVGSYSSEFEGRTIAQGVELGGSTITAVYLMLGSNGSDYTLFSDYEKIVDHLLEYCPNATIYLQTIPYSSEDHVHYEDINKILVRVRRHYADAGISRVLLIDTHTAFGERVQPDGIHLTTEALDIWYHTLVYFADYNNISQ